MTRPLWIVYMDADSLPDQAHPRQSVYLVEATLPDGDCGTNGLILRSGAVMARRLHAAGRSAELEEGTVFEDRLLEPGQRDARDAFRQGFERVLGMALPPQHSALVYITEADGHLRIYQLSETTEREALALFVTQVTTGPRGGEPLDWILRALSQARDAFAQKLPLLGTRMAYQQWRPEMELERKFTFDEIPDTWQLEATLFEELYAGRYPGFFPEPHMGIQIFDYENHLFEVSGPPAEQGYISFIPQVDGKVTVKRKWFSKNAELRRETLWPGEALDVNNFPEIVAERVAGTTRALPVFRRKRLDVNYESLETGHVFGVYFDICTTVDAVMPQRFGQVEVEYCRSRTLQPLEDVLPEFEALAAHVQRFLTVQGVRFQHDLYSKLDFARDCAARQVAS